MGQIIRILLQLQVADQEWDEKGRLYQAARQRLTDQSALDARRQVHRGLEERLVAAHTQLRDAELELASLNTKAREVHNALYGGRIRSTRELEGLQQDYAHLCKRSAQLEEQVLLKMSENDDLEAAVKRDVEEMRAFEAQWNAERQSLNTQCQSWRARLQQLQALREQLRSTLPRAELALYEELRTKKSGVALVPARDSTCQYCRVTIPALKARLIETGEGVVTCEGCGRILYQG